MKSIANDFKLFLVNVISQGFTFYMVCGYLIFSYLRPQMIVPQLNILPWTQICILSGLVLAFLKKQIALGSEQLWLLLFLSVIYLSVINSVFPSISEEKFSVIVIWFVEVVFFSSCVKNKNQLNLALIVLFLIMFKMSFYGARVWVSRGFGFRDWGIAGPTGFFANSGEFSLLMAMVAVISFCYLKGFGKLKTIYSILPLTAVMTVLGASSRGGQLALAIGIIFIIFKYRFFSFKYLIAVSLAIFLIFNLLPDEQIDRFRDMGNDNTSQSRLKYWTSGWEMMKEHPWFGVGFYGFADYYSQFYNVPIDGSYLSQRKEVAHNSFIEVGSTVGFPGLTIYMILLLIIYRNSQFKTDNVSDSHIFWMRDLGIGLQAGLAVYVVGSSFMSVAFYPYVYLLLMITIVFKKIKLDCINE